MALEDVLSRIPGYAGYRAAGSLNQQEDVRSLGQLSALQGILSNQQLNPLKAALMEAQIKEHLQKVATGQQQQGLLQGILSGATSGAGGAPALQNPDTLRTLGLLMNKPEYITHAERLDTKAADARSLAGMQSRAQGIQPGAMYAGNQQEQLNVSPEDAAAVAQIRAGQGIPTGQGMQATANPPAALTGGSLSPLFDSPYVGAQAKQLQQMVNSGQITAKDARAEEAKLLALHTSQTGAASRQQITIDNRTPHNPLATSGGFMERQPDGSYKPVLGPDGKPLMPQSAAAGATIGDFTKTGDAFLETIPLEMRNAVKKIANYETDPKTLETRGGQRSRMLNMVAQYDPSYDDTQYANKRRAITQFGTGKQGDTTRSLNVAIEHIDTLDRAADALKNGEFTPGNKVYNEVAKIFGKAPPNTFEGIRDIVSNEVLKGTIGTPGGVQDRAEFAARVKASNSPDQLKDVFSGWTELMGGQVKGLEQQYKGATGLKDFRERYLTPRTSEAIDLAVSKAGGGDLGTQIKALGVDYEPDKYEYRVTNGKVQRKAK